MARNIHEELVAKWKQTIWQEHEDDSATAAYWDSIDHKQTCEVCRDDELLEVFARMKRLIF